MTTIQTTNIPTKHCSLCRRILPVTEFHRRRHHVRSGIRAACKDCTREITRVTRAEIPYEVDRLKQQVRSRTRDAIRRGELAPLPCSVCGSSDVQAHHLRYDTPNAHLEVDWLCHKHHALEHGKRPWTNQMELFPALG